MEDSEEKIAGEQQNKQQSIREKRIAQLQPWQYKKGQSGNPAGRPKGISLKEYVKMKFTTMTEDEREEFMHGLPKEIIWKMGEGAPEAKTETNLNAKLNISPSAELLELAMGLNKKLKDKLTSDE